jgi:hypothetical protein
MAAKPKINWEMAEFTYVTGEDDLTYQKLAGIWGVSYGTLNRRARHGDWRGKRKQYRLDTAQLAQQKAREAGSDELAGMNTHLASKFYQLADESLDAALATLSGKERRAHTITAATATDKWRLLTNQTTDKRETYQAPNYSPEELAEHVAEVRKILATLPDEAVDRLGR